MAGGYRHQTQGTSDALAAEIRAMRKENAALRRALTSIAVLDGAGNSLTLSALAFGLTSGTSAADAPAGARDTWSVDDISVTVPISSGRMLVLLGAKIALGAPTGTNTPTGYYGFAVAGPTPAGPTIANSVESSIGSAALQVSGAFLLVGLAPGTYTITGQIMRTTDGTDAPPSVDVTKRSVLVLPY